MELTLAQHTLLIKNLCDIRCWPSDTGSVKHIETHISSILLVGALAYKVKKPVNFGFLDFSTLALRHFYCQEELRLNRRLAPDIYLNVIPITGTVQNPQPQGKGEPIDYAVRMVRFAHDSLLSLHPELLTERTMEMISGRLSRFHQGIARAEAGSTFGEPEQILTPMQQNFEHIVPFTENKALLDRLETWTREQHQRLRPLLAQRKAEGFVRECHGDLHLGNIALDDGRLIIFDGIEFNPQLRWIDTISELAFLLMDLKEKERHDLAGHLLNHYLEQTGDYAGVELLRFYQLYRAMVRAKVTALRLSQADLEISAEPALRADVLKYLALAEGYTRKTQPTLIITHGLSGSGKSYATRLIPQWIPAVRIRSDVERKRLAGLVAGKRSGSDWNQEIYTPAFTRKTYSRLYDLTALLLHGGQSTVVDATFLQHRERERFRSLASSLNLPFLILDFHAPESVLRQRVIKRETEGTDPSEAGLAVLEAQIQNAEPLTKDEQATALIIIPEKPLTAEIVKQKIGEFRSAYRHSS